LQVEQHSYSRFASGFKMCSDCVKEGHTGQIERGGTSQYKKEVLVVIKMLSAAMHDSRDRAHIICIEHSMRITHASPPERDTHIQQNNSFVRHNMSIFVLTRGAQK
jgi:hypothetical protein